MAKNFYAVKTGQHPETKEVVHNLVFTDWNEASKYVTKTKGVQVEYKGLNTRYEVEEYLGNQDPVLNKSEGLYPKDALHCYVDGSYSKELENYSYSLVCVQDDKVVHWENGAGKNKDAVSMQQIGGELLGAMKALLYTKKVGAKTIVLFHDYKGVGYHAVGYSWKRDNAYSENYYQWMQKFFKENPQIKVFFCKVDAHSNDDFNDLADGFAKLALDIKPESKFKKLCETYHLSL